MKKSLFITFGLLLIFSLVGCSSDSTTDKKEEPKQETVKKEDKATKEASKPKETKKEEKLTRDKEIANSVKKIVKKNYIGTTVTKIEVNENMGTEKENDYIVLPYLKWDVKNSANTTKEMLKMYSDDLAAQLAKESDVEEITVFWEVPYHLEGNNIAKFNYTRSGNNMAIGEVWYAPNIR
ncbi:hypothetical protein [Neobacillus mesonae]|uniref:hypothetical protein n=1 Tax=Neobacillus mesonae TaxID=1193713 RepID=UPI0025747A50|nr:hypothetical protein [Neobacillus mesonae]